MALTPLCAASTPVPLSEDGILACLARYFPQTHPSLLLGRGDDCAVLKAGKPLCVSSDLFLEDIHFRRSYFSPEDTGHKALAVNISDLAACGARPCAFTLCLGLPDWVDMPWLEAFFSGMATLADKHRIALAGGDLSRCGQLHISVTVWGEPTAGDGFLTRGGSMPGDILFLVGQVGLARTGLAMLEKHGRDALELWPDACAAHLRPQPQVDAGLLLARAGSNARPPALMDLSDGIMRDLPRLLGLSGGLSAGKSSATGPNGIATVVGASTRNDNIYARARSKGALGAALLLPRGLLHPEVVRYALDCHKNPVHEALLGGEDYALLGSCASDMLAPLHAAIPGFVSIGTITHGGGITCNNEPLDHLHGFDHFEPDSTKEHIV